jgi:hypothetical protein
MNFGKAKGAIGAVLLTFASLGFAIGCDTGTSPSTTDTTTTTSTTTTTTTTASTYKDYLYMTDTVSGKLYCYDPATQSVSSSSIAATGQNATGEIQFYKGVGYAAVGFGTNMGVYYFDPSATNPAFTKLGASVAAQYFAFCSETKAYVTVAKDWYANTGELYSFNPSNPSAGLTQVAGISKYAQDAVLGTDLMLYVAQDRLSGEIVKINPATDAVVATYAIGESGTTGLAWGNYNGKPGVFVASTSGSIRFIEKDSASGTAISVVSTSTLAPIYPARVVQLADGNLIATGYNHSYVIALSGTTATVTELKNSSGSSFGALDIAYKGGLVYIPVAVTTDYVSYKNYLYVLDGSGAQKSYSPVSVMTTTEGLSNIGFWE